MARDDTRRAGDDALLGDTGRLEEIQALGLLSPEVDEILQRTAEEAATRLDLPTGLVSIVMDHAQYFAAHYGLTGWMREARGTPIEWSFCVNAVRSGSPFVVEDATRHPGVRDNPVVTEDGVRCYAGIPLVTSRGYTVGTLCVAGTQARSFTPEELDDLRALARKAVERIEARRPG